MAQNSPLLLLLVPVLLALVLWPLARASGKAEARRMSDLRMDLGQGKARGLAIVAFVVGMVVLTLVTGGT